MFVSLFAESFGLVEESCAPYRANSHLQQCSDFKHCPVVAKVKKGGPIGGFFGAASELEMMKEIRKNGPIVADFEPWVTFQLYSEGVYKDKSESSLAHLESEDNEKDALSKLTAKDYGLE